MKPPSGIGCFAVGVPAFLAGAYIVWAGADAGAVILGVGGLLAAAGVGFRRARRVGETSSFRFNARAAAVAAIVPALCAGGLLAWNAWRRAELTAKFEKQEADAKPFRAVCLEGKGVPEAAGRAEKGPRTMLVFSQDGWDGSLIDLTLDEARPPSIAATQLVACARYLSEEVGSCEYEGKKGKYYPKRKQYALTLSVRDARTGATVVDKRIDGTPPPPCPDAKTFGFGKDPDIGGSYPLLREGEAQAFLREARN